MRTTLNIEDSLVDQAARLTGITEKTALVRLGLEALIAAESAKQACQAGRHGKTAQADSTTAGGRGLNDFSRHIAMGRAPAIRTW